MSLTIDLEMAYHMGYDDALARRKPDASKVHVFGRGTCHDNGGTDENGQQVFDCSVCGCVLSLYDRDGVNTLCTSFIYDYPRFCPACGREVVTDG